MRSLSLFALVLASLTLAAQDQPYKTPKVKPYHSESKRGEGAQKKGGVSVDKKVTPYASSSKELTRVEQQTTKSPKSSKTAKRARSARVVKAQHEKNPPIRFSSSTGTHGSIPGKSTEKSRVRQKGHKR